MALVKCSECGNEVSDDALKCPKCGKQLRKPKRTVFGKICIWGFYLFNAFMAWWLYAGFNAASEATSGRLMTEAEKAGAAIGTGMGAAFIIMIWVVGAVITGLFALLTRPKS